MADVASLLAEFQKGIEGKDTGLGATVKFDFEGLVASFLMANLTQILFLTKIKMLDCNLYLCLLKHLNK